MTLPTCGVFQTHDLLVIQATSVVEVEPAPHATNGCATFVGASTRSPRDPC